MDRNLEKKMDQWLYHAFKSGDLKLPRAGAPEPAPQQEKPNKGKKHHRGRRNSGGGAGVDGAAEIFTFLKTAGLIDHVKKEFLLKNKFTGYLSVAKSGVS